MQQPPNILSKLTHEMTAISRSMHNRPPFRYTGFHPPSNQPTNQLARLATPQPSGSQRKPTFYSPWGEPRSLPVSTTELKFTRKKTRRPKPRARGPSVRVRAALRPTMPANHDKQRHGFAVVFWHTPSEDGLTPLVPTPAKARAVHRHPIQRRHTILKY